MARSNFVVRGGADFSGIKAEIQKTQKQLNGFTQSINKGMSGIGKALKAGLAYVSVRAISSFAKAATDLASDLTEVQNVVDVTFGSMAKDINEFAKTSTEQFGLSELSAKKFTSTMGAMLKSSGITGDVVRDMSIDLAKLSADMASFYNLQPEEAFQKIMSGMSGMTMPLKELGINMNIANLESYALSKGIKKSYQQMSQAEQTILRYNYLLSATKDAQGDFARNSHTWANQTKILAQQWDTLKSSIGQGFINMLMPVIKLLNTLIQKIQLAARYFASFTASIFGSVKAGSQGAVVTENLADIEDGLDNISNAGQKAAKTLKSLMGFDELNILSKDTGSSETLPTSPISPVSTISDVVDETPAVSKLAGIFKSLFDMLKNNPAVRKFRKDMAAVFDKISSSLSKIKITLKDIFEYVIATSAEITTALGGIFPTLLEMFSSVAKIYSDIFDFIVDIWINITQTVKPSIDLLKSIAIGAMETIKNLWAEYGEQTVNNLSTAIENIKGLFQSIWSNIIAPILIPTLNQMKKLWDDHIKGFIQQVGEFALKLYNAGLEVYNGFIKPIAEWLINTFGPVFTAVFNTVADVVYGFFGTIYDIAKGIFKVLGGIIDFIRGAFSGDWKLAWEGIKDIFGGIWETLVTIVKAPINAITSLISGFTEKVKSVFSAAENVVTGWFGAIQGIFRGFMNALNDIIDFIEGFFAGGWKRAWQGIKDIFKGIFDSLVSIVKIPINVIIDALNVLIKGINSIRIDIPWWAAGLANLAGFTGGYIGFNIPQIPKLAAGAYFDANSPQLAIVGDNRREGEIVAPESKIYEQMVRALRDVGTDKRTELIIHFGPQTWRTIIDGINDTQRAAGRVLIEV